MKKDKYDMALKNNEHNFNYALGAVLQTRRRGWRGRVASEMNGSIFGGGRADNLVYADEIQPVVVEAAFAGTGNVDGDAIARLGKLDGKRRSRIMTAVALVIPKTVRDIKGGVKGVEKWLASGGELEYAVYSQVKGEEDTPAVPFDVRYPDGEPNSGYICGTAADLADLIELAATPDKRIKQVAHEAGGEVRGVATIMNDALPDFSRQQIAEKVGQPPDMHAMRVAACIWLNALVLHGKLAAAMPDKITPPHRDTGWQKTAIAWKKILKIDYKSVFRPALESLDILAVHGSIAEHVVSRLSVQAGNINTLRLGGVADVSSDIFPELATDRAETAAFYTLPEVAELLAGLAFNLMPPDAKDIKIADFACGTGALLKAAYRHVRRRAEPVRDGVSLHKKYMEKYLHGADIQPIAAHLTAAGLAGMNPGAPYGHSNIICAGVRNGKTGSLDLLKSESLVDLFGVSAAAGADKSRTDSFSSAHNSFDLCIMNPPYTRNRGGRKLFDVQGVRESERQVSIDNLRDMLKNTFANGKAGMASAFCVMGDRKLKEGGILAAVLPLTAAGQSSWQKFRAHIMRRYSDVVIVGLVPGSGASFSADTGMEEMLICGRKNGNGANRVLTVINLCQVPRDFVEAHEIVRAARNIKNSGELKIGEYVFGTCIKSRPANGGAWGAVGVKSNEMGIIAENLIHGKLITLGLVYESNIKIPLTCLSGHLEIGPTHHLIGHLPGRESIGAFAFRQIKTGDKNCLSLWEANYQTQIRLVCAPTHRGGAVKGRESEAKRMQEQRSTLFISRNLRMTSQKLAAAMTSKPHMGGRGWAALLFSDNSVYAAYCLWFNGILGLIARWQCGGKQHPGRAQMQLTDIGEFPCPVFSGKTAAAKKAVKIASKEFPRLAQLDLMSCSYAWRDENRREIDKVVLRMLDLEKKISEDDLQLIREEWCREPSVHGDTEEIIEALEADELI
ncbi:MAG: N-6 DNA methylase [Gammaproteobacteria bacterium]